MSKRFHERFEIYLGLEEAKSRFQNRLNNKVYLDIIAYAGGRQTERLAIDSLSVLGRTYQGRPADLRQYFAGDFYETLEAVEAIYAACAEGGWSSFRDDIDRAVRWALSAAEVDLQLSWAEGRFSPSGAESLDEGLVNDPLRWLRGEGFETVVEPYEKGLRHFLRSQTQPELLRDAVTDMYEALEALAKIITDRDKDLSGNRELFVKRVRAGTAYKKLLREYIAYANDFRHAPAEPRPAPRRREVESFIYLTGVFIRLAMPDPDVTPEPTT